MPSYKTYGTVVRDVLEEMVSAVEAGEAAAVPPGSTGTWTVSSSPATVRRSGGPPPSAAAPVSPSPTKPAPAPMEWSPTPVVPSSSPVALDDAPSSGIFAASEHWDNNNDGDNNDDDDDADSDATVPKTMPTIEENDNYGDSFTNGTETSGPEDEPRGGDNDTARTDAGTAVGSGGTAGTDAGNKTKEQIVEIPIIIAKKGTLGIIIGETKDDAAYVMAVSESVLDECRGLRPGDLLARSPLVWEMLGTAAARTFEYYRIKPFKHLCEWATLPLRFTAVRTVLSIQIDQPGPLGFEVEEYVPKGSHSDATQVFKQAFTRVASVDASHAQSSQVQVGDFICYPGSRGGDSIPRDLFINMSSCRPLCFDVIRPGKGKVADNKTTGTTTVAKGLSLVKQTKAKYNPDDVARRGLGLKVAIPITVDGAGKLGISIGRRTSDGAVYVMAVSEYALDGCRYLRPGDLLAMAPTRTSTTSEPSPFVPGAEAAARTYEYYSFEQFKNYLSEGIRPLRFTAVRCILPIRIDQPGPLGFAVEEYVPKNGDTKEIFTRVASVDASHTQSSKVQVGDIICRYGSRGSVNIPRDLFNKLSSKRFLCFDVIRRCVGKEIVANTGTMNKGTTTGTATVAPGVPHRSKPALTAGPPPPPGVVPHASSGTMNTNTDEMGRASMASAKSPVDEDGRCTSSSVADSSSAANAPKQNQCVSASRPNDICLGFFGIIDDGHSSTMPTLKQWFSTFEDIRAAANHKDTAVVKDCISKFAVTSSIRLYSVLCFVANGGIWRSGLSLANINDANASCSEASLCMPEKGDDDDDDGADSATSSKRPRHF